MSKGWDEKETDVKMARHRLTRFSLVVQLVEMMTCSQRALMNFKRGVWITCFVGIFSASVFGDFKAGAATRIITPNPLLPVSGGMGPTAPASEKRGELTVRALVFESENAGETTRVAIVQIDALGFPAVLSDRVRTRIKSIPPQNIVIGATHTHSAPDFYAFPDGKGGHTANLEYVDSVCQKAADAITEAVSNLQTARLKIATGEAQGKIAYNYYAPDLYDQRVSTIQAIGADQVPIATLINYAIHPEVLGANVGIVSPDLIGPLCDRVEAKVGGVALFMNGACGGMVTADNRNLDQPSNSIRAVWKDSRTWEECVRIGQLLADESLRTIADTKVQSNPTLTCYGKNVEFPVDSDELWAVVTHSPLNYQHGEGRSVATQVNVINIGNAQILTIPGEALPNIGFYLKRKMRGEHNMLFGLTNDAFGYILTKVDFNSFKRYDYISRVSMGEMTGEIFIRESLQLIDESSRPTAANAGISKE